MASISIKEGKVRVTRLLRQLVSHTTLTSLIIVSPSLRNCHLPLFSTLTQLRHLQLGNNDDYLEVSLEALLSLTNLTSLDLSGTDITDEDFTPLSVLSCLRSLTFDSTHSIIQAFPCLPSLTHLEISFNSFYNYRDIWTCTNLQSLILDSTNESCPLEDLPIHPSLTSLSLAELEISAEGIQALALYTTLTQLNLTLCRLNDTVAPLLSLPLLRELNLSGCGIGIEAIEALVANMTLEILDLSHTDLSDPEILCLSKRQQPWLSLDLGGNTIGELKPFAAETLIISSCDIHDVALLPLKGNTILTELNLGVNSLTESSLPLLAALPSLTALELVPIDIQQAWDLSPLAASTSLLSIDLGRIIFEETEAVSTHYAEVREAVNRNRHRVQLPLLFLLPLLLRLKYGK